MREFSRTDKVEAKLRSAKMEHQKLSQDNTQLVAEVLRLKKLLEDRNKKFIKLEETVDELREEVSILTEIKNELSQQMGTCQKKVREAEKASAAKQQCSSSTGTKPHSDKSQATSDGSANRQKPRVEAILEERLEEFEAFRTEVRRFGTDVKNLLFGHSLRNPIHESQASSQRCTRASDGGDDACTPGDGDDDAQHRMQQVNAELFRQLHACQTDNADLKAEADSLRRNLERTKNLYDELNRQPKARSWFGFSDMQAQDVLDRLVLLRNIMYHLVDILLPLTVLFVICLFLLIVVAILAEQAGLNCCCSILCNKSSSTDGNDHTPNNHAPQGGVPPENAQALVFSSQPLAEDTKSEILVGSEVVSVQGSAESRDRCHEDEDEYDHVHALQGPEDDEEPARDTKDVLHPMRAAAQRLSPPLRCAVFLNL
jgi:hypothetical protein